MKGTEYFGTFIDTQTGKAQDAIRMSVLNAAAEAYAVKHNTVVEVMEQCIVCSKLFKLDTGRARGVCSEDCYN